MLINKLRYAAHHTTKFLNRSFGTAVKYARMFDQGMDTIGRIAKAVTPTIDQYAGTSTARHARQINDDYPILRARVMGSTMRARRLGITSWGISDAMYPSWVCNPHST